MHIALADKPVVNSQHHLVTLATLEWNRFALNLLTFAIDVFAIEFVKVPHGFTVYIFSEKDRNAAFKQDAHQVPFLKLTGAKPRGCFGSPSLLKYGGGVRRVVVAAGQSYISNSFVFKAPSVSLRLKASLQALIQ